ncbi:synergin gamma isoform X6 [Echinops telfairi]|uniref:Synergin gamma isoform X6 n=1 Tax=Echinops telfairi TaxID=9371 RepID=A0AC55DVS8_ECHTE|nr:synergin gamma isoform X6 [Echinops telfairi]
MFPVASGIRPPQGLMPMQQQGYPVVSVMQPNMQGMMGMNYSTQMSQGPIAMQAGIPVGPIPAAGIPYMGQAPFLGLRPPGPQYTPDMQKQFAEEQQKRFEQQQKLLEEERKRRQFEEQKQKLRLLSSVKPKIGEKSRDDALEAIKGNLDGFSRDAKMHPTPASHPKKPGVGVFPPQDPIQQRRPPWIYNESLVPDAYKKILETTMTPTGIDTAKLYPILMSSGLPRETLGQIWALANRTTPGKLTKEELYTVLAMIAVTQRGVPTMSPDTISQFPSAPIPTLSGFPMTLTAPVSQPTTVMPSGPAASIPLNLGQPVMGINLVGPMGGAAAQPSGGFLPAYPANQMVKPEEDDFQDFQDASKPGSLDDSFRDFQELSASSQASRPQPGNSAPSLLIPLTGTKTSSSMDKYAVFKGIAADKASENTVAFGEPGDKYSAFRELEQTTDSTSLGLGLDSVFHQTTDKVSRRNSCTQEVRTPGSSHPGESFAEFRCTGTDDGFTDFKTAESISPLEPPAKEKTFPTSFPSGTVQTQKPQTHVKNPLNLADLDMFSSVSCSNEKPVSVSAAFSASKSVSTRAQPTDSAATAAALALTKTSSLADEFGEFNLFGGYSSPAPVGEQDDFADFMAFSNSSISAEQKAGDKFDALKEEAGPGPLTSNSGSTGKSGQNPSVAPTKYDVFKQLSLEGSGLGVEELKESTPSGKSDDDFADFHSNKFSSMNSDKSLGEKAVAFRHTKEDSASVKSLDLPSIGGSSVGKEDSEDALSVQFDMKLADVGGDLKHVMSDSSLDLPTVSGQHPPAADIEDLKYAAFGTYSSNFAVSALSSFDWSDRDDASQGRKLSPFVLSAGSGSSPAASVLPKKETSFGSSESITMTSLSKVTTFPSEDALPEATFPAFANFKDGIPQASEQKDYDSRHYKEFTSQDPPSADRSQEGTCSSPASSGASHETPQECPDDFGEFQSEKPKISKFDFLLANSQSKMKSSEEMIKSELATFDLSVQGSHRRSLSLGDKEMSRSSPAPALEQPFRDRSSTLSEKPALPVIRDKYKDLTGEVEENERYAYEWQRCLGSALDAIKKANDTLNGISSSTVCTEVIQSARGMEYLLGVVEVYRVTKRVELGIKATAVCSEKLQQLLKDIDKVWNNLISFMSLATLTPDENSLDFSSCMLRPGIKNAQELACGVCLLNVDSRSRKEEKPAEEHPKKAFNSETDNFKLAYGGHQYHASCANFWINCVEPKPPGLILPDLL